MEEGRPRLALALVGAHAGWLLNPHPLLPSATGEGAGEAAGLGALSQSHSVGMVASVSSLLLAVTRRAGLLMPSGWR